MFLRVSPPSETVEASPGKSVKYPIFVAVFVVLFVLSIHGVRWLPFYYYPGLDLQNLYVFHHLCPGWPIPYDRTGAACGDPLNRPMVYPPLAYWTMSWVRFFSFRAAVTIWAFLILALTGFGVWLGSLTESRIRPWIWGLAMILLGQMPFVYAVERGNIDALVIPVFMGGAVFFTKRRGFLAGICFATACWMKVYPVIPSVVLFAALVSAKDLRKSLFWSLLKGFTAGGLAWGLVLLPDSYRYIVEVLPRFMASEMGGYGMSSHTLYRGLSSLFLKLPLLGLWTYFVAKRIRRDPLFTLSAALAISTFFQNLSNDYNLITAFPFLFLLMNRLLRRKMSGLDFAVLLVTFAAFVGDRTPLEAVFSNRGALFIQIIWFIGFPIYLLKRIDRESECDGNLFYDEKGVSHGN